MANTTFPQDTNISAGGEPLEVNSGQLTLVGNDPEHVFIKAISRQGVTIPAFGSAKHGTWYTGGLGWATDGEFCKFIKFEFMKSVTGVDCDLLPYSDIYGSHGQHQDLCLLATPAIYDFTVSFAGAPSIDPKIIVTPVNPDPNG